MAKVTEREAKKIILDLIDAGHDTLNVSYLKDGLDVDIPLSRIAGKEHKTMTMEEAERRTDTAIRNAFHALTGKALKGDPVDFINK